MTTPSMSSSTGLVAESISKSYGQHHVLVDCSLRLSPGECLLLQGISGGGKSTLLRILALLEPADAGTVSHGSRTWLPPAPLPASPYPFLSVVFQQLFLWPNLTMAQNIALVLSHRPDAALSPTAKDMVERFSISALLHRYPHECSLGERQRLAIVRALLSDARFVLLDEPSSALDRANKGVLLSELSTAKAAGRGLLVITHDDRAFDSLIDGGFELENGRLTAM